MDKPILDVIYGVFLFSVGLVLSFGYWAFLNIEFFDNMPVGKVRLATLKIVVFLIMIFGFVLSISSLASIFPLKDSWLFQFLSLDMIDWGFLPLTLFFTGGGLSIAFGLLIKFEEDVLDEPFEIFMNYLKNENYEVAFDMLTPELKEDVRSAQKFQEWFVINNVKIISWENIFSITEEDHGQRIGKYFREDNSEVTYEIHYLQVKDSWKIQQFSVGLPEKKPSVSQELGF